MISYQPLLYSTIVLYHNTPMYSLTICDLLSENLTGLYNSGFEIFAIEIANIYVAHVFLGKKRVLHK